MYHVSKLKNGITLITVPIKGTKATTVLAMFPVGSRYETAKMSGCSHFVEHLMFKGTVKRPTTLDISRALDSYGSQYNAFTSKEYTGYYIKIAGNKQAVAYDILSDMLYNSQFVKEEVEKEKGAIVEELRMYKDNPLMDIENIFETLLFGETPLGREIGGTEATVRGVSREELWEYYQQHYSPKNMVVVIAGDIDRKKLATILPKTFEAKLPPKGAFGFSYYKKDFEKIGYFKKKVPLADRVFVKQKKVDQSQLMLGFPGLAYNDKREDVLDVLSTILGGAMSSRLFIEVRERRGLAYMIRSGWRCTGTSLARRSRLTGRFRHPRR
jgi:predicted Zn-dependent peptidase